MSRSFKKNVIYKDKGFKQKYWKNVRSAINNKIRSVDPQLLDETVIPDPKEIVNDYNYCDYIITYKPEDSYYDKIKRK